MKPLFARELTEQERLKIVADDARYINQKRFTRFKRTSKSLTAEQKETLFLKTRRTGNISIVALQVLLMDAIKHGIK